MPITPPMRRICDFILYVSVGLLVVVGAFVYERNVGADTVPLAKWGGLAVMTAILFGYAIAGPRGYKKEGPFWLVIGALLFVHVLVFAVVLQRVEQWKAIWFVFFFPLETAVIEGALRFSMQRHVRLRRPVAPKGPRGPTSRRTKGSA